MKERYTIEKGLDRCLIGTMGSVSWMYPFLKFFFITSSRELLFGYIIYKLSPYIWTMLTCQKALSVYKITGKKVGNGILTLTKITFKFSKVKLTNLAQNTKMKIAAKKAAKQTP